MKLNRKFWIGLTIVLVIAGGIWGVIYYSSTQEVPEETADVQTATVRQGDLEIIASGVGEIIPFSEIDLSFSSGGLIGEIFVRVGDHVEAGEVLAKLGDISKLEADVASAELNVIKAEQSLEDLFLNEEINAALAQVKLADAQKALEDATYTNNINQVGNRADETYYAQVYASYLVAQDKYEAALSKYETNGAHLDEDNLVRANLYVALEEAKDKRDAYANQLLWFDSAPSEIDQAILDADVTYAKAVLGEAEREWNILKEGPNPYDIVLAEANLADAKAKLALAQEDLAGATLIAPMNGTILEVNAEVGETIGTGAMVSLANLDQPLLKVFLDESDFDKFDLDLPVEVIFDAFPNEIFTGVVDLVNPVLLTTNGVPTVTGLVKLDPSALEAIKRLPIGSNATIDIIAARTVGAILVPVEAIREISDDQYAVFVMENGEPQLRIVEVGLIDISFAEILSGLEVGDVITTGLVETE